MSELVEFLNRAKATNETITGLFECIKIAVILKSKALQTEEEHMHRISEAMESLYKEFKQKASMIKKDLNRMKSENEEHLNRHGLDRGFATRNNFMQNLIRRLALVIQDFGKVQSEFLAYQKERLKKQYLIAMPQATHEELTGLDEKEKSKLLLQSAFTLGNKTAKEVLIHAEKRRNSIENILNGISELKDLADDFLAIVQGGVCDMDKVHVGMHYANTQSKSAQNIITKSSKRKMRIKKVKKTITCFFVVFIVVMLLIVAHKIAC